MNDFLGDRKRRDLIRRLGAIGLAPMLGPLASLSATGGRPSWWSG